MLKTRPTSPLNATRNDEIASSERNGQERKQLQSCTFSLPSLPAFPQTSQKATRKRRWWCSSPFPASTSFSLSPSARLDSVPSRFRPPDGST